MINISDFLNSFIDNKEVVPSTLDGIKSCITLTIKVCTTVDYTTNYELSALLSKYHKDCPVEMFTVPDWNLVLVLERLCMPPFEPITQSSLKHLTYKCVFLIAMACSCRVSELHALAIDKVSHTQNWGKVFLEPKSDFLAKNQANHQVPNHRCFTLKALVPPANKVHFAPGSSEETRYNRKKLFCPVRALRFYLARTKHYRKNKSALFISLNPGYTKDITKQSIGNWVRHTINLCYALAGENHDNLGRASVHEIRSITTSLRFERNLSLATLLKSCVWKNNNTFTKYYLKNVAVLSQELYRLPPVWISQCLLNAND